MKTPKEWLEYAYSEDIKCMDAFREPAAFIEEIQAEAVAELVAERDALKEQLDREYWRGLDDAADYLNGYDVLHEGKDVRDMVQTEIQALAQKQDKPKRNPLVDTLNAIERLGPGMGADGVREAVRLARAGLDKLNGR